MEKGTILVLEVDNNEVLPLNVQLEVQDRSYIPIKEYHDSNYLEHIIKKLVMKGD